jgi:hypothetical protein
MKSCSNSHGKYRGFENPVAAFPPWRDSKSVQNEAASMAQDGLEILALEILPEGTKRELFFPSAFFSVIGFFPFQAENTKK